MPKQPKVGATTHVFEAFATTGQPILRCSESVHAYVLGDEPGLVACQCKATTRWLGVTMFPSEAPPTSYNMQWLEV